MIERNVGPIELVQVSGSGVPALSTLPRSGSRRQAETAHETVASTLETTLPPAPDGMVDPRGHPRPDRAPGARIGGALLAQGSEQAADPSGPARDLRGPRRICLARSPLPRARG